MNITECEGYRSLLKAVEQDEAKSPKFHDYRGKMAWVVERAQHYGEMTDLDPAAVLDAWEKDRDYWYMNFYQDCNQPKIEGDSVRVFDNIEELTESIGDKGFRCPMCKGVSKSPYECDTGLEMSPKKVCDWKSYGLFGTLGKGVYVFVKSEMKGQNVFAPVAWENETETIGA